MKSENKNTFRHILLVVIILLMFVEISNVFAGGLSCDWPRRVLGKYRYGVFPEHTVNLIGTDKFGMCDSYRDDMMSGTEFYYKMTGSLEGVFFTETSYGSNKASCERELSSISHTRLKTGSWCAIALKANVGGSLKYHTYCGQGIWDEVTSSCVICGTSGGSDRIFATTYNLHDGQVSGHLWGLGDSQGRYATLGYVDVDGTPRVLTSTASPNLRVNAACASYYTDLDAYWCDGYRPFVPGDAFDEHYIGKGLFRPNQYRKIVSGRVQKTTESDNEFFDSLTYSAPIASESLEPIAHACLTVDEYGQGECASYCNIQGKLMPMQCVDDTECPNVYTVLESDGSTRFFPLFEIKMIDRYCTKTIPFKCEVNDVISLEENREACVSHGSIWTRAGEHGVGQYPSSSDDPDRTTYRCCGNDVYEDGTPKEFPKYRVVVGATPDYTDVACCNSASKCVYGGRCYSQNQMIEIEGKNAYCYNGVWIAQQVGLYFGRLSYTELPNCGDYICDLSSGENCFTCPEDCSLEFEFSGSRENFEELIMNKGSIHHYPTSDGSMYHSISYGLTWSDIVTCEIYSENRYKSAFGWGLKKANYVHERDVPACSGKESVVDCDGTIFWFEQEDDVDGLTGDILLKGYEGDTFIIRADNVDAETKDYIIVIHERDELYDEDYPNIFKYNIDDLDYFDPEIDGTGSVHHVLYIQDPLTVRPTCLFDSECESNNCAKFGKIGMCCPRGQVFDGTRCVRPPSFVDLSED